MHRLEGPLLVHGNYLDVELLYFFPNVHIDNIQIVDRDIVNKDKIVTVAIVEGIPITLGLPGPSSDFYPRVIDVWNKNKLPELYWAGIWEYSLTSKKLPDEMIYIIRIGDETNVYTESFGRIEVRESKKLLDLFWEICDKYYQKEVS